MGHAQTYQMKWPDQLSHVKEKAQHNKVSQVKRKKACKKKKIMRNSQRKHPASPRQTLFRISIFFSYIETLQPNNAVCNLNLYTHTTKNIFPFSSLPTSEHIYVFFVLVTLSLTHAGDDAVHGQPGGGVIKAGDWQPLVVLLLLLEDKSRVLLLGDVDVVAGVSGGHDVAGAGVQEDALVVLPLHSDQTHAIPAKWATVPNVLLPKKLF